MTNHVQYIPPKLTIWQYCYAMVFASQNSPLWRKEHAAHWGSFRCWVICIALILSCVGILMPLIGLVPVIFIFLGELVVAVMNQDTIHMAEALDQFTIGAATICAWIIWFKMALSWFEMQRLGVVLPVVGTLLALIPTAYYVDFIVFVFPCMALACFLCAWHMADDTHTTSI